MSMSERDRKRKRKHKLYHSTEDKINKKIRSSVTTVGSHGVCELQSWTGISASQEKVVSQFLLLFL